MMLDVVHATGQQVVKDDHFVTARDQEIDNMRTEESGSACYEHTHLMFPSIQITRSCFVAVGC
jgi:hypothetical protein